MRCRAGARATRNSPTWVPAQRRSVTRCTASGTRQSSDLSMNLFSLLQARAAAGKPVRVALIGAGKFGSMFLSQVPHVPGLEVPVIIDLDPQRAKDACKTVGWNSARIAATTFTEDC